uniref:peptidyl-prolyl cis-trans isomerase-like 2 isoform X2 n=1 Tax=Odobenus rosmarus divergens TaxID=9708 RepID=UPI00063C9C9F|nr:PREDICTED: peptidyl-prolyl cis-trans isomerase-like 2 isoform X2 [Odobenus rosmarus divergens]
MGKRQHQKDKMYITCAEYTHFYGGKKPDIPQANFRRLPFDHCSLSLQPFVYPVCTPEGVVFDLLNIVPWLKKYGTNPSNGEKLDGRSLIKLNFAKNKEGKYHCPVLFTVFTNNTHIVAVRTTGNVYTYEAVEQLNIKAKNFRDLLTDEPFSRQDIITLQDPTNLDKFNVSNFFHVKNNIKITDPDEEKAKQDPSYYLKNTNAETRETLQELYKEFKGDEVLAATMKVPEKKKVDKLNAAHYSTGKVSASFTSTAMVPETTHEAAAIDEDVLRYQFVKKKGYVRLHTNKGDLNLELHCDMTPKTCENFIKLCKKQYYDGTIFHRSIRNFVIQGGDPTGTGTALQRRVPAQPLAHGPGHPQHGQLGAQRQQVSVLYHLSLLRVPRQEAHHLRAGPQTYRQGVGKYINPAATKRAAEEEPSTSTAVPVAKKKPSRGFGDFSSW